MKTTDVSAVTCEDVGKLWDENARLWTYLIRNGHDLYRDHVNTPGFFSILPDVKGLRGLDIGCGEGDYTRHLAQRGAMMTGVDISPTFIELAQETESNQPLGINYIERNAVDLQFNSCSFEFTTAVLALMNIPDYRSAIKEAYRVLKYGGFLQLSITHPCFWSLQMDWSHDEEGKKRALLCQQYFEGLVQIPSDWIWEWVRDSSYVGGKSTFTTVVFKQTLSEWLNALTEAGFVIEKTLEPRPSEESIAAHPEIYDSLIVPFFLVIQCRKYRSLPPMHK